MKETQVDPPKFVLRFFRWFCNPECCEDIEGDLHEVFQRNVATKGVRRAKWLFAFAVLKLFRPGIVRPFFNRNKTNNIDMFKSYLFTAFRNMKRDRLFALMNITGLAVGIGCGLVIYKIISYEFSHDRYHRNYRHVYRLITEFNHPQYGTGYSEGQVHPLGEAVRNDFPGIDAVMTFYAGEGQVTVTRENGTSERFLEYSGIAYVEPNFFKLFDYQFVAGDPEKALINTGSVVITTSIAQKYFGTQDDISSLIGKTIAINGGTTLMVTAVVSDPPANTDIPFTIIGDYRSQIASNPYFRNGIDWNEYNSNTNCYLLASDERVLSVFEQQLPEFLMKYCGPERASFAKYLLQPLSQLHFDSRVANYTKRQVSYGTLSILGVVGLFLVVSACINFINMSTAQAIKRAKEIGVRKSLGVRQGQLVGQFLSETMFIATVSSVAGLAIAQMLFILLESILGYKLELELFSNPREPLFLVGLILFTGLLSGAYPSVVMARMNPIAALKNHLRMVSTSGNISFRRTLVVTQFVISQVMIIGTIVAGQQMSYFLGNDIGFTKEAVIITKLPDASPEKLQALRNTIAGLPGVKNASLNVASPMAAFRVNNPIVHTNVRQEDMISGNLKTADENYIDLFRLQLIAGRNLPVVKDTKEAVVTRKLTQTLGYDHPEQALGDKFKYASDLEFTIIGVVEDFHSLSFHQPMENVILSNLPWNIKEIAIELETGSGNFTDVQAVIERVKFAWDQLLPETIFDYAFLDDQIARLYKNEQRTSRLFTIFSVITIIIGCLGLYGLVSYMANQKTKEIGIRKVMGASATNIVGIFSREMILLTVLSFFIATPIGWSVMNNWLEGFEYKVQLSPLFFAMALLISTAIAFITIGYKTIAASRANPVDALKSE